MKKKAVDALARAKREAFVSCRKDDPLRLQKALEAGIDVDVRDEHGLTLLMWAARKGALCCASILIRRGAAINAVDVVCRGALHHAAMFGKSLAAALLIKSGANLRHRDKWGQSALSASMGSFDPATYGVIRQAMVDAGVVLDEDELRLSRLNGYKEILANQPRGVRESDLPPNEALELQRFHASPAYRPSEGEY